MSDNKESTKMKIIVCVAKNNGILFNHRRVSRDVKVLEDIADNTPNLVLSQYSMELFEEIKLSCKGDIYKFIEEEFDDIDLVDEIILYHWNRAYPADVFLKFNKKEFELIESRDFEGNSHERITKEIWIKR